MAISCRDCDTGPWPFSDRAGLEHAAYNSQITAEGCVANVTLKCLWLEWKDSEVEEIKLSGLRVREGA